jgi:TolB-like protein
MRKERIEPMIRKHHGRVFQLTGDGILVELASVVEAVECAAAWQREALGDLRFRIGINLGEVLIEDGDVFGNGVNIAARLEGLADPGGICLSGTVYDEVRGKLDLFFEEMGPQSVKNIAEPMRAYRVAPGREPRMEPARRSPDRSDRLGVAVLPLNNLSAGVQQDTFADGITEDIITALSRSYALKVSARNSTFAYKGQSPEIRDVARALDVKYVLEGSVRQGSDRVRITVQLVEAVSGGHVWVEQYDRPLDDELAVQDEILVDVAPHSSQTWRLLSRTCWGLGQRDESWSCVQRALRLDPNDGDIIGSRGVYHIFNGEPEQAMDWLDRVLELHADTPQTVDIMYYWKALAQFSAADYLDAASTLRNVSGHGFLRAGLLAACHARLGQLEEAGAQANAVLTAQPEFRLRDVRLWKSFRLDTQREDLVGALRQAGLPD